MKLIQLRQFRFFVLNILNIQRNSSFLAYSLFVLALSVCPQAVFAEQQNKPVVVVSVQPLASIVERIAANEVEIEVNKDIKSAKETLNELLELIGNIIIILQDGTTLLSNTVIKSLKDDYKKLTQSDTFILADAVSMEIRNMVKGKGNISIFDNYAVTYKAEASLCFELYNQYSQYLAELLNGIHGEKKSLRYWKTLMHSYLYQTVSFQLGVGAGLKCGTRCGVFFFD